MLRVLSSRVQSSGLKLWGFGSEGLRFSPWGRALRVQGPRGPGDSKSPLSQEYALNHIRDPIMT